MGLALTLPWPLQRELESATARLFRVDPGHSVDFTCPAGEPALVSPSSVSWRVFKNPITLFVGGVAAVVLELAEPRIRSAIWERSGFRIDPLRRIRRTGLAAMVTVYGARSVAEAMIAQVVRMHAGVNGTTRAGVRYAANDPALLTWVHATAAFGFVEAYRSFARNLEPDEVDRYYAEGCLAARLYGAPAPPASRAEVERLMHVSRHFLEPSPVIGSFLDIMLETPAFPAPLGGLQRLLVRAAAGLIPAELAPLIGSPRHAPLGRRERWTVAAAAKLADRIVIHQSPAMQACRRMGLPVSHLYD